MTASDVIAGWSAGLAALFVSSAIACVATAADMRRQDAELRRIIFMFSTAGFMASLFWWQSIAAANWVSGSWTGPMMTGYGWRLAATVFLLSMIGSTSFPRCGHRGWLWSLAVFLVVAGGVATYASVT